ncbi:glycosyltransferase family 4 protein [Streptomyces sp. HPF1205]|uniref:glycosyltransferase family 4 protein n=1 Tax=Streptomyces sp. HPF1205 TaxID=2873262 RepID=UPI001CED3100|nr:glycosyltransferase family 4 protein [Streptomyces sp. HPF1205]
MTAPAPMRVLAFLPVYGPADPTGAFVTTREYLQALAAGGHLVHVVTSLAEPGQPRTDEGVSVWPLPYWWQTAQELKPELVITHHGDRRAAKLVPQLGTVPQLLMVHGMARDRNLRRPRLAWFPSQACRDHYAYRGPSLVLPPAINPDRYRTTPGQMIALNGSTRAKGAHVLSAIAERIPELPFLVVRSAGHPAGPFPPNVSVIDRLPPRELYARTRLLLMPSATESYGRVGVEAMLSGIPVIASPLAGMCEAFGEAAVYVSPEDIDGWVREIRRLSAPRAYATASARAKAHVAVLDYPGNLAEFEAACLSLRSRHAAARGLGLSR